MRAVNLAANRMHICYSNGMGWSLVRTFVDCGVGSQENSENFIILRLLRDLRLLLGIEQFGNCEKPVVKNRQRVDGHLPTSAAAIHPRLRHFGDNDL